MTEKPDRSDSIAPDTEPAELLVLSDAERDELIRSLEEARAEIARGDLIAEYQKYWEHQKGQ